jgi:chloride channel 7
VQDIAQKIHELTHQAFPVLHHEPGGDGKAVDHGAAKGAGTFHGTISVGVLRKLLKSPQLFGPLAQFDSDHHQREAHHEKHGLPYHDIREFDFAHQGDGYVADDETIARIARDEDGKYAGQFLDLAPYINTSSYQVQETFSLDRTFLLFRTMGVRHMTVVDKHNHVTGMITRKDLMGFKMEEKIGALVEARGGTVRDDHGHHGHGDGAHGHGGAADSNDRLSSFTTLPQNPTATEARAGGVGSIQSAANPAYE